MLPNISSSLIWLERNPNVLKGIHRGLERETIRVTPEGTLAMTPHPECLGSKLTHRWITTDFAESMLEFITPVEQNIQHMMAFLMDLHSYAVKHLDNERLWPLSMPCFIASENDIKLAYYGTSNTGQLKTLYREGLKNRYGSLMQLISGVHYNFSLPLSFWQAFSGVEATKENSQLISDGYLRLIRNYYRFGWIIPYLFGASPAICSSFIRNKNTTLPFEKYNDCMLYLPYATSLRMSDLGYTNKAQGGNSITFNSLNSYIDQLRAMTKTPSNEFKKIGLQESGYYKQINENILQIENELYAPIRPKRVPKIGESATDALLRGGIEYIEVRALDVNPFDMKGVTEEQLRFLDLFLIWCVLAEAPELDLQEMQCIKQNWDRVILEGRKPNQTIGIGCQEAKEPLKIIGTKLFNDLFRIAKVLDQIEQENNYENTCHLLIEGINSPEKTLSALALDCMKKEGILNFGMKLAEKYYVKYKNHHYAILNDERFLMEQQRSFAEQKSIEAHDTISFDDYLTRYR